MNENMIRYEALLSINSLVYGFTHTGLTHLISYQRKLIVIYIHKGSDNEIQLISFKW